jgi:nuclear migration protein JNM1
VGRSEDIDVGDLPSRRRALKVFTEPGDLAESPRETQLSRLRRLQAEVAQLERELHSSPAPASAPTNKRKSVLPPRQAVDVVSELSALRERLNTASEGAAAPERKDFADRLAELEVAPERKEERVPSPNLRVGDVDRRLAVLERTVGVADTDADSVSWSRLASN